MDIIKVYLNNLLFKKKLFIQKNFKFKKNVKSFISFFKLFINLNNQKKCKIKDLLDIWEK